MDYPEAIIIHIVAHVILALLIHLGRPRHRPRP